MNILLIFILQCGDNTLKMEFQYPYNTAVQAIEILETTVVQGCSTHLIRLPGIL